MKKQILVLAIIAAITLAPFAPISAQTLSEIDQNISEYEKEIKALQAEEASLKNEIKLIDLEIAETEAEIERTQKKLKQLGKQIEDTSSEIIETEKEIDVQKQTLSEYLKLLNQETDQSLIKTFFSSGSLSEVLDKIKYNEKLQEQTQNSLDSFLTLKKELEEKKEALSIEQEEATVLLEIQDRQQQNLEIQKQAQKELLAQTQGEEEKFQELFKNAKSKREDLIIALATASSSPDSTANLGELKSYANEASAATGVRAPVILALLEQESYFGRNVGNGRYTTDMNPNQHNAFLQICNELGKDPASTPVSRKPLTYTGWGGAMGPAQIMPTGWLNIRSQVASLTGSNPNPWNIRDATFAAAVFLRNLGAANAETEKEALARYFAGNYWKKYIWYAESVLRKSKRFE